MTNNNKFKPVQIYRTLQVKIATMAKFNEIHIKVLASKIVECMLEKHPDEIEEIIKKIKITKK